MRRTVAAVFLFIQTLFVLFLLISCIPDEHTKVPEVTLSLSQSSPQTTVIISWDEIPNADGYSVTRTFTRAGTTESRIITPTGSTTSLSVTDSNCEPGTEYTYTVTATFYKYSDRTSEPKSITTSTDPKNTLDFPQSITVKKRKTNALNLSWDSIEGASSYEIYQSSSFYQNFSEKYQKIADVTETSYTVEHLFNEHTYYFMVKAISGDEYSLFSPKVSGTVASAENLTKSKAFELTCGTVENFYTYSSDSPLWFSFSSTQGKLTFKNDGYSKISLSFFDESGLLNSGISLKRLLNAYYEAPSSVTGISVTDSECTLDLAQYIPSFTTGKNYVMSVYNENSFVTLCVD